LTACRDGVQPTPPDAAALQARAAYCTTIVDGQIAAWDTRDPERIREVYTDDIVHFDNGPGLAGIDKVISMSEMMFRAFPEWPMAPGDTYISADKCAGEWVVWDIMSFTQDEPGVEFDVLETRDDKISYWRLLYDQAFYEHWWDSEQIDVAFLNAYAEAWSSGDPDQVAQRYARNGVIEDTLLGVMAKGRNRIATYATNFLEISPNGQWSLDHMFGEGDEIEMPDPKDARNPSDGGVFSVNTTARDGTPCTLRMMVILTPDDDGYIQHQEVFWDAESLSSCGWSN
jgi:ketosteroid isomerase-like protein